MAKIKNKVPEHHPLRIGIIVNAYNYFDISEYKDQFTELNNSHPAIKFILIGYVPEMDKFNLIESSNMEYTNPISIIHYFKHLKALKLNLLFIPLADSDLNISSENFNKFVEASILNIPVITKRQYPYSKLMRNQISGFVYEKTKFFINMVIEIYETSNRDILLNNCAVTGHELVSKNIQYTEINANRLINAFD